MSDNAPIDAFFAAVPEARVLSALPEGVSVTFHLTGDGGGTWTVSRGPDQTTRIDAYAFDHPDCRLRCSVSDFRALILGELDPKRGFLENRLIVEGDVGLVWRLRRTFSQER